MDQVEIYREQIESMEQMLSKTTAYMDDIQKKLEHTNDILHQRNEEIMSSMRYAHNIQNAIISNNIVEQKNETYHYYLRQKDWVGGDFPFHKKAHGKEYFSVIDCTGHGVPGGLLTMLASQLFEKVILDHSDFDAGEIISQFNTMFYQLYHGSNNHRLKDGMDLSLVIIDREMDLISMASARRPIEMIGSLKHETFKGDKCSIGEVEDFQYNTEFISSGTYDFIYLYSDGFPDQFGSSDEMNKAKKYKVKNFRNFLNELKEISFDKHNSLLADELKCWKGELEQTDDILVMGINLKNK